MHLGFYSTIVKKDRHIKRIPAVMKCWPLHIFVENIATFAGLTIFNMDV